MLKPPASTSSTSTCARARVCTRDRRLFVPGLEGVGRIRSVGADVSLTPGQRVAWDQRTGFYASQLTMKAERVVPIPDTLAVGEALLFQAMTAQYLATEYRAVQPGDRVLVQAAAGGVGQLLVQ